MSTDFAGETNFVALTGFGGSFTPLVNLTNPFDISDFEEQHAFMVPVDGTITAFSVYFSSSTASNFPGNTVTVQAQLWRSSVPDNVFSPIAGSLVSLSPSYTGAQPNGTFSSGSIVVNEPVFADDRLMLVYQIISANPTEVTLLGFISAGVTIQ
jgi:BclB C-terminal domain-containing protein